MTGIGIIITDEGELHITNLEGETLDERGEEYNEILTFLKAKEIEGMLKSDRRIAENSYLTANIEAIAENYYYEQRAMFEQLNDMVLRLALQDLETEDMDDED